MEKNANTWFPGDLVRVREGTKTASASRSGTLQDVDAATEVAFVRYDDGKTGWVDLNKLEKNHG